MVSVCFGVWRCVVFFVCVCVLARIVFSRLGFAVMCVFTVFKFAENIFWVNVWAGGWLERFSYDTRTVFGV